MHVQFEQWLIHAKADIVLAAGPRPRLRAHPPRVQRRQRQPVPSKDAPVYITIGDSGNIDRGRSGRPAASATTRWTSRTARTPTTQPARTAPRSSPTASGSPTDTACQPTTLACLALPSDRIVFVAVSYNSVGRLYPNHHIDHDNVHVTVMSQMRIHQDICPKL
jgi:hypothetical protein